MPRVLSRVLALVSLASLMLFAYQLYLSNFSLALMANMVTYYVLCLVTFILGLANSFKHRHKVGDGVLIPLFLIFLSLSYVSVLPAILDFFSITVSAHYLEMTEQFVKMITAILFILLAADNLKDFIKIESFLLPLCVLIYAILNLIPVNNFTLFNYTNLLILIILIAANVLLIAAIFKYNTKYYYLSYLYLTLFSLGFYLNIFSSNFIITIIVVCSYIAASIFALSAKPTE